MFPDREVPAFGSQRRTQLPTLAPRNAPSSRAQGEVSGSGTGRQPRPSNRSRAGCWTCRARKVKCDERHPKCGPCLRLNRSCDWEHRWNFSDATTSTQNKYSNITTSGNFIWDPQARSPTASPDLRPHDDMPAFAALTNDSDRERKAETRQPGTFRVIVTPESFADLPEYSASASPRSRRGSIQSLSALEKTNSTGPRLSRIQIDPDTVVLERFEDVSGPPSGSYSASLDARRPSLPDRIDRLSIDASTHMHTTNHLEASLSQRLPAFGPYESHFRHYVVPRLVQPQLDGSPFVLPASTTRDIFEYQASRFPPLAQAICALSALHLSYNGAASMDAAHQHYGQALSPSTTAKSEEELLVDGSFLRHFLLLIYDLCIPMQHDESSQNMWAIHLEHLQRIALLRNKKLGTEKYGYIIWAICELDVYACLLGSGNCSFIRTIKQNNMLPLLEQQLPVTAATTATPYLASEVAIFPAILALRQGVLCHTAKIAQAARKFREEAAQGASPGAYLRWQATATQFEVDLDAFWMQARPQYLHLEPPHAGKTLPSRPRYVFEQALLLYRTASIYLRTSMFPRQRTLLITNQPEIRENTETRIKSILSLAASQKESGNLEQRHIVFPVFIAGFATTHPDTKVQALNIIKGFEGQGIGQNTYTTRQLLVAVYEEQRRVVERGGRMEAVDWLAVARERGLTVVNCGL